jgi:hypothetical protein
MGRGVGRARQHRGDDVRIRNEDTHVSVSAVHANTCMGVTRQARGSGASHVSNPRHKHSPTATIAPSSAFTAPPASVLEGTLLPGSEAAAAPTATAASMSVASALATPTSGDSKWGGGPHKRMNRHQSPTRLAGSMGRVRGGGGEEREQEREWRRNGDVVCPPARAACARLRRGVVRPRRMDADSTSPGYCKDISHQQRDGPCPFIGQTHSSEHPEANAAGRHTLLHSNNLEKVCG